MKRVPLYITSYSSANLRARNFITANSVGFIFKTQLALCERAYSKGHTELEKKLSIPPKCELLS